MQRPPNLQKGDTVGLCSTARAISIDELRPLIGLIESWGLSVKIGRSIGAVSDQYAGDDSLRRLDLQQFLDDPQIQAIWCARGGYGTVRLIDGLEFEKFLQHPKWLVGYSDVTVLHSAIHNLGVETIHANMAHEIQDKTAETRESIKTLLFGESLCVEYGRPQFGRDGRVSGQVVGGNLSLLYSLIGSPTGIETTGKILFIEDLDEMLYHIDRMMINLKRNGLLKSLAGLVVGGMSDMKDNTIAFGKTAQEIVWEAVQEYDYPVAFDYPAGHIPDNRALAFGRNATLDINPHTVSLSFDP